MQLVLTKIASSDSAINSILCRQTLPIRRDVVKHFMGTRTTILALIITALLFSFKPNRNPIILNGQIKLNPKDTTAYVEGLIIFKFRL